VYRGKFKFIIYGKCDVKAWQHAGPEKENNKKKENGKI